MKYIGYILDRHTPYIFTLLYELMYACLTMAASFI